MSGTFQLTAAISIHVVLGVLYHDHIGFDCFDMIREDATTEMIHLMVFYSVKKLPS